MIRNINRVGVKVGLHPQQGPSRTVISSDGREKVVLWFGSGPPRLLSVAACQPDR